MLHRAALRFVALFALLAIVLVAAGCSDTLDDAATVGSSHITQDDLRSEVSDLLSNNDLKVALADQFTFASNNGSTDARLTAAWLSFLVRQVAVDEEFKAKDLKVTQADNDAAKAELDSQFTDRQGQPIVSKFPKAFRDRMLARFARLSAVSRAFAADVQQPTAEDARRFYEQNKDQLFACPSAKSVSHIVVATEAEANDVLAQLQGGANFATLAGERSTDEASKNNGGLIAGSPLGCFTEGEDPALDAAVKAAAENEPTGPVKTNAGYQVIEVKPYVAPEFEDVQDDVLGALQRQAQQNAQSNTSAALSAALAKRLTADKVRIDPRFGKWVVDDQGARVQPPTAPSVRETRTTTSTIAPPLDQLGGDTGTGAPGGTGGGSTGSNTGQ